MHWIVRRRLLQHHTYRSAVKKRTVWVGLVSGAGTALALVGIRHLSAAVDVLVGVVVTLAGIYATPHLAGAWSFLTGWEMRDADPLLHVESVPDSCVFEVNDTMHGAWANAWASAVVTRLSPHKNVTLTGGHGDFIVGGAEQYLSREKVQVRVDTPLAANAPLILRYNDPVRIRCYFTGIAADDLEGDQIIGSVTLHDKSGTKFPPFDVTFQRQYR